MIHTLATLLDINDKTNYLQILLDTRQKDVQEWLSKTQLKYTRKDIKNSVHLRSIEHGFEMEFQNGKLQTFFAYFRTKKISCFEYPLKFGINKGWTIKGAVMYLGQPLIKSNKIVQIIYPHLGLGLVFHGFYNNQDSLIDYAYFYAPESIQICAACKKQFKQVEDHGKTYSPQSKINICKCRIVKYCSKKCQSKHIGQHLIFCNDQIL